jgi:DNA polymerase-3 subunit delta
MEGQRKPSVYLFFGDDIVAINEAIAALKSRLGDPSTVELNYSSLDGRAATLEQIETAGRSLPFLSDRRLTVINHPLAMMQNDASRTRIISLLESLPQESAVVLAEYQPLQSPKDRRQRKKHWLQKWAESNVEKVYIKEFRAPGGSQLAWWIVERAQKYGGNFEPQAAIALAGKIGEDVQLADHEIEKLLTYVNNERLVTAADVEELTAQLTEGAIFDFVDALGTRNRQLAAREFHRLLADQDVQSIFGMIVRQFRLLVQSREVVDRGGGKQEIVAALGVHPYVGEKLALQARQFSQAQLDGIFHRLLMIDSGLKMGEVSIDLSVDLLIAEIT